MKKELTKTEKLLIKMLQENTGKSILDSGGAYGRNWERNQGREFLDEPVMTTDLRYEKNGPIDGVVPRLNIFHYLNHFLEVTEESEKLNEKFNEMHNDMHDLSSLEVAEKFLSEYKWGGFYGGEDMEPKWSNTYNGDTILSQVLQYSLFDTNEGTFICLQIHGGCDIRGGYTKPQIFEMTGEVDYFIMAQSDVSATDGETTWDSDNAGYSFWATNGSSRPDEKEYSFAEVAIVYEGKLYNSKNGKRLWLYNQIGSEEMSDNDEIVSFKELERFVQDIYNKGTDIVNEAKKNFEEFASMIDVEPIVNRIITEIESHTLKLEL